MSMTGGKSAPTVRLLRLLFLPTKLKIERECMESIEVAEHQECFFATMMME